MQDCSHGLCPKCNTVKPLKSFKKLATPSQMRAWGKEGAVRMTLVSKYCRECRPKPRPLSKLSPAEIKQRIVSGETIYKDPAKAEKILANRIERSTNALIRSGKEHQYNKKRERWAGIVEEISTTHKRFDLRLRNLQRRALPSDLGHHSSCRDFLYNPHIAYTTACVDALTRIKLLLKSDQLLFAPPPPSWQHLLSFEETTTIQSLYNVLPKKGLRDSARLNITKE
jgi:hypothetical protein